MALRSYLSFIVKFSLLPKPFQGAKHLKNIAPCSLLPVLSKNVSGSNTLRGYCPLSIDRQIFLLKEQVREQ
jgi:hypothetical protein